MQGIIGKKVGMTSIFDEQGRQVPVTVLECGPCMVLQHKTIARDGYEAVQLAFEDCREQRMNKPEFGVFKKAGLAPKRRRFEMKLEAGDSPKPGDLLTVSMFEKVAFVDVSAYSKGKGFQGVVRRHGMRGGPITHGGHSKRRVGSIGCRELPGRVHKNKRMPGQMGNTRITQQNLQIVKVMPEDNVLLVRGAVPGSAGGIVLVRKSVKKGVKE